MAHPKRGRKIEPSSDELRDKILGVARRHFAQMGFQGVSLKDIAAEAGVANSLINYHFTDKDGLFAACVETFARTRMDMINRILTEPRNRDELRVRVELFVSQMIDSVLSDPYGFEILEREMRAGNARILQLFQETLLAAFKNVVAFFQQAQQKGFLKPDIEPLFVASLLFTSACDTVRKDFLGKKFFGLSFENGEWREKYVAHVVDLFFSGVLK